MLQQGCLGVYLDVLSPSFNNFKTNSSNLRTGYPHNTGTPSLRHGVIFDSSFFFIPISQLFISLVFSHYPHHSLCSQYFTMNYPKSHLADLSLMPVISPRKCIPHTAAMNNLFKEPSLSLSSPGSEIQNCSQVLFSSPLF